jgi:hypothetical protein
MCFWLGISSHPLSLKLYILQYLKLVNAHLSLLLIIQLLGVCSLLFINFLYGRYLPWLYQQWKRWSYEASQRPFCIHWWSREGCIFAVWRICITTRGILWAPTCPWLWRTYYELFRIDLAFIIFVHSLTCNPIVIYSLQQLRKLGYVTYSR